MYNFITMIWVRRTDRMRNQKIWELVGVYKGVNEVIDDNMMRHIDKMKPRKEWIRIGLWRESSRVS